MNRWPNILKKGDKLALVLPSSPPDNREVVDRGAAGLSDLGFQVVRAPNVEKTDRYLAGSDRERASDLSKMCRDRTVKGIVCGRGGYGSARLLKLLDFDLVRRASKPLVGFSDATSLLGAIQRKSRLVTFHGPMVVADFSKDDLPSFTAQSFTLALTTRGSRRLSDGYKGEDGPIVTLRAGRAKGPLVGGNLTVLTTLLGTPWQPRFKDSILFFEDVGEAPYKIDRCLTHLINAGALEGVRGVAAGIFIRSRADSPEDAERYRGEVRVVLEERLGRLKIPIVSGLPFGHSRYNATLPVGGVVTLDGKSGELILE